MRALATCASSWSVTLPARDILFSSSRTINAFGPGCPGSVTETHHLSKLYSRGLYALQDLSLSVDKGEFVLLTGPSGAGQSTLPRLLLLAGEPREGEIFVNGHDLTQLSRSEIQEYRRGIGFILQDFKLIPTRTVFEKVAFVLEVLGVPS